MAGVFQSQKRGELLIKVISFVIVTVGGVVFLLPFLWMLSSSLKSSDTVAAYPPSFLPHNVQGDRINQDYIATPETGSANRSSSSEQKETTRDSETEPASRPPSSQDGETAMDRVTDPVGRSSSSGPSGTVTVSGTCTGPDGEPVADASICVGEDECVRTDSGGRYHIELPVGYTGMVTAEPPEEGGAAFQYYFSDLSEDQSGRDFHWTKKCPVIAGQVRTEDGRPLEGILLTAGDGGGWAVTDSSGHYRLSVPYDWGGDVTPRTEGLEYDPASRGYSLQWVNYVKAMQQMKVITHGSWWTPIRNTLTIVVLSIVGQILASSLVGYGFARIRFRGSDVLFIIMLATMMLPGQVTMIPVFILFRQLGWVDTFKPLVVPAFFGTPFFIFLFRQYFLTISVELEEAARIDGCGFFGTYTRIILPLSKPLLATVAIFTFMGSWNDFMGPLIYLSSPEKWTLALALDSFKGQYGALHVEQLMACSVVMMLPCLVLFFICQKYFVRSVVLTGVKG